jgi:hypothetical protein
MNIVFENNKECSCYKDLVNNATDRGAIKRFTKHFGASVISAVLKTHNKLKLADNAHVYNSIASVNNKIEKLNGQRENDPLVLKIRIQDAYRKLFYFIINPSEAQKCCEKNWTGQFAEITDIHVFKINKHDYKSL